MLELLAGPGQNPLRDLTERIMLGPDLPPPPRVRGSASHRLAAVVASLVLLLVAMALVTIPYAGLPLAVLLGAALQAYVWLDAAAERCGYPLAERARLIWHNRWRALGLGLGLLAVAGVPFLNVLLLPSVAAVAATSCLIRCDKAPEGPPASPPG